MIKEFIKETEKNFGRPSTPAEAEIFKTANQIYDTLHKGDVKKVCRTTITKLVKAINPELSDMDVVLSSVCIESLVIAFTAEFLSAGVIISIKKK